MKHEQCDHLLPDHFEHIGGDSWPHESLECLLHDGHAGEHLGKFQSGVYLAWLRVEHCQDCSPEEVEEGYCDCFEYHYPDAEEIEERLSHDGFEKE
ncbi:hypothetical protein EBR66_08495 [bacterium]|nr:hypothetical protein [bacterium]